MKKVLFVVSSLRVCGPINQLYGIVSNLNTDEFEYKIITLSEESGYSMMADFEKLGVSITSSKMSRIEFALKGKKELKHQIESYDPDVIHTTGVRVDSAVSKSGYGHKQVMSIRNYAYEDYIAKFGKFMGTLFSKDTIKAINRSKYPVCCSYSLQNMYEKHTEKKLFVVQNGVNVHKFKPADTSDEKIDLRRKLKLPESKKIFIAVGSLIERKDPLTIIKAFKEANDGSGLLILLGDGKLMDSCKDEATEDVLLLGNVTNVIEYLQASDVYVSASYSEGLPNSVLEAGRTGVKLILSDIPQHREIFMHGLKLPDMFIPGNEEELRKIIHNELKEERVLNTELSDYIKEFFSTEVMAEGYMNIYKDN